MNWTLGTDPVRWVDGWGIGCLAALVFLRLALRTVSRQRFFWVAQWLKLGAWVMAALLVAPWVAAPWGLPLAALLLALSPLFKAFAGYLLVLTGRVYAPGERITLSGACGEVIGFGFLRTTLLEMGGPPGLGSASPGLSTGAWPVARRYTGRVLTLSNATVLGGGGVRNFTRGFPFVWEELSLTLAPGADRDRAEMILLECVSNQIESIRELDESLRHSLEKRFPLCPDELKPRVYSRLTAAGSELSARFLMREGAIRDFHDQVSRELLRSLENAGIPLAEAERVDRVSRGLSRGVPARSGAQGVGSSS